MNMDNDREPRSGADEVQVLLDSLLAEQGDTAPAAGEAAAGGTAADMSAAADDAASAEDDGANDLPLDKAPPQPRKRRSPLRAIGRTFVDNVPHRGDGAGEWVRKCAFWLSLVVLIVSLTYVLDNMWWQPAQNAREYGELEKIFDPTNSDVTNDRNYPVGMLSSFTSLYDINPDVRGWIGYNSTDSRRFLKINYPVVYSGDNEKYLKTDFRGKKNKCGALFFDKRNTLETPEDTNKVLIVYGHNMASGQMFAGLNRLIGNVGNAKASATLTLSTLYQKSDYKVISVLINDEQETNDWYFDARRTAFSSDADFLSYVDELRARSMFDYPVDVQADDTLLVLSTCTARSSSKLDDGRLTVIARRVRDGESSEVDTASIRKNDDVIMPRAWYIAQDLPLHEYYEGSYPASSRPSSSTTVPAGGMPTFTLPSDTGSTPTDTGTVTGAVTRPSGSQTQPTAPGTQPTKPGTQPTKPATQPTQSTQPTQPTSSAAPEPTAPPTEPTPPPTEPTPPPTEPEPSTEPEPVPPESGTAEG